jgi:predicted component of type VI protein secretion system
MKAELVPDNGDPPIPITRDITVIGRREACDIRIDHPSVSKRHCVVVRTSGFLILRDLVSTNGTKVKGQRIRWAALLPGDKVSLGGYKFRIYLGPDDAPSPSELRAKEPEPILTGFGPPTPPVVEPLLSDPIGADPPSQEVEESPPVIRRKPVGEDENRWEKFPAPADGKEFFIELD